MAKKVAHKFIGGHHDGEIWDINPDQEFVKMVYEREDRNMANPHAISQATEIYKVWDLTFVDKNDKEHKYNICYIMDMTDAEAFHQLIKKYGI